MQTKIFTILSGDIPASHFIRIGNNRNINIYVGRDEYGRYSFDFRGSFKISKTKSSEIISVSHINCNNDIFLRFSLERPTLLEYFCTFCEDLMSSCAVINDDETAYHTLRTRYFSWKQLFKPNHGNLSEIEIMGLIGELLFLKGVMIPDKGLDKALESWTGPEKTHKDFSLDEEWYEIKTIAVGKETVHISSVEQLDSDVCGSLVVYALEKMSTSYNGLRLNALVTNIIASISSTIQKDYFLAKLGLYGFDFSPENDNYVYDLKAMNIYKVEGNDFPRVMREKLPKAISKIQYDIVLSNIEKFKIS